MHLPVAVSDFLYGRNAHTASDKGSRASARETTACICRMVCGLRAYIYKSTLGQYAERPYSLRQRRALLRARRHPAYAGWSVACELTFIHQPWGRQYGRNAHTASDNGARASARETTSCICRMVWGLRAYIYKSTLGQYTRNAHTASDKGSRASISVSHSVSYRSAPESMVRWSVSPLLPGKTMPHGCFHPVYCAPEAPDPPPADT